MNTEHIVFEETNGKFYVLNQDGCVVWYGGQYAEFANIEEAKDYCSRYYLPNYARMQ